jgi:hypothetical protein
VCPRRTRRQMASRYEEQEAQARIEELRLLRAELHRQWRGRDELPVDAPVDEDGEVV